MKEIWKDIENYKGLYQISNLGRVKSLARLKIGSHNTNYVAKEIIRKMSLDKDGYNLITLTKNKIQKSYRVHVLIGQHFVSNPNNLPQINHLDGVKTNNHYKNLEWCTAQHNITHAIESGLRNNGGENCHLSKLNEDEIIKIRELKGEYSSRIIGGMFGVSGSAIRSILNKKTWKYVV